MKQESVEVTVNGLKAKVITYSDGWERVIVLDIAPKDKPKNPMCFVNPEIITKSINNSIYEEGCLSVPGQFAEIVMDGI